MKVFDFTHNLWVSAQLAAPPSVQRIVIPRLHEAKELGRLLAKPYQPVYQLQGQGHDGLITVTYIGLEYPKPFLKKLLFREEPVEQRIGKIPFWRYDQLAYSFSSDIVIVVAIKNLIRKLSCQNAIVLPEFVFHILDVQGDWSDVKVRFRASVRYDLRLTRKYGYQYETSHADSDFEMFYNTMYLPTMKNRHGNLSSPMSVGEAYQYFRYGFLFFVNRNGQRVCGGLCYPRRDSVHFIIMGVINGDEQLIKEGAIGALNTLRIQWVNQHGYKTVNFLGTAPFLKDGLFQQKRKWGSTISVPPHLHRQIWIKVQRNTPAVSHFLKENPLVMVDEQGRLNGLVIVDDPHNMPAKTKEEWKNNYVTPGLSSLVIRSVWNFAQEPASVPNLDLIIPIPCGVDKEISQ